MKKSTVTPRERGRPVTRRPAAAGTPGAETKRPVGRPRKYPKEPTLPQEAADTRGGLNESPAQKKRAGASPASVDSSHGVNSKRRRTSSDTVGSIDEKWSNSSRTSSREKIPALPGRLRKEVSQFLQNQATPTSVRTSERVKTKDTEKTGGEKIRMSEKRARSQKRFGRSPKLHIDLKDSLAMEMKRLSTTQGFWSLKSGSRSSSPTQGNEVLEKTSRTSTPEVSPSSARRKSLITTMKTQPGKIDTVVTGKQIVNNDGVSEKPIGKDDSFSRKQKEKMELLPRRLVEKEETLPALGVPTSEMRRLKTTEGFWSSSPLAPRSSSRNASPSSISSLEKGAQQNSRPHSQEEDQPVDELAEQTLKYMKSIALSNLKHKSSKSGDDMGMESDSSSKSDRRIAEGKVDARGDNQTKTQVNDIQNRISKFRRSKELSVNDRLAVHRKSRLLKYSPVRGEFSQSTLSKMRGAVFRGLKRKFSDVTHRKFMRKEVTPDTQTLSEFEKDVCESSCSSSSSNIADNTLLKPSTSPEFALSDLLGSSELKRLDTTAGFWAPTPDIGIVLGVQQRRLRDVDGNSQKETHKKLCIKRHPASPVRPQCSILQLRKKKLHFLQHAFKRKRKFFSKASRVPSNLSNDTKPKVKTFYFGARKRKGKRGPRAAKAVHLDDMKEKDFSGETMKSTVLELPLALTSEAVISPVRRPRGRPRKIKEAQNILQTTEQASSVHQTVKRGRGRRKLTSISVAVSEIEPSLTATKSVRGRPRKTRGHKKKTIVTCSVPEIMETGFALTAAPEIPANTCQGQKKKSPSGLSETDVLSWTVTSLVQKESLKTWKRGRKKKFVRGDQRTYNASNVRTRGKEYNDLNRTLEVLETLEPQMELDLCAADNRLREPNRLETTGQTFNMKKLSTNELIEDNREKPDDQSAISEEYINKHNLGKEFLSDLNHGKKDNLFESLGFGLSSQPLIKQDISKLPFEQKQEISLSPKDTSQFHTAINLLISNSPYENSNETADVSAKNQIAHPQTAVETLDGPKDLKIDLTSLGSTCGIFKWEKFRLHTGDGEKVHSEGTGASSKRETSQGKASEQQETSDSVTEVHRLKDQQLGTNNGLITANIDLSSSQAGASGVLHVEDKWTGQLSNSTFPLCPTHSGSHGAFSVAECAPELNSSEGNVEEDSVQAACLKGNNFDGAKELMEALSARVETELGEESVAGKEKICREEEEVEKLMTNPPDLVVTKGGGVDILSGCATSCLAQDKDKVLLTESLGLTKRNREVVTPSKEQMTGSGEIVVNESSNSCLENQQLVLKIAPLNERARHAQVVQSKTEEAVSESLLTSLSLIQSAGGVSEAGGLKPGKKKKKRKFKFVRPKKHKLSSTLVQKHDLLPLPVVQIYQTVNIQNKSLGGAFSSDQQEETAVTVSDTNKHQPDNVEVPQKGPLRQVKRRRKNAWRRGVLRKAVHVYRKAHIRETSSAVPLSVEASAAAGEDVENKAISSTDHQTVGPDQSASSVSSDSPELSSVVKKKLAMLKRLQTNANLAAANVCVNLDEIILQQGRSLRDFPRKGKSLVSQRKQLAEDPNIRDTTALLRASAGGKMKALIIDIPSDSAEPPRRKRGRPRKNFDESLPKLTPTYSLPIRLDTRNKPPPQLSPQVFKPLGSTVFFPPDDVKSAKEGDLVSESVDETDFHLYLSSTDEDTSATKDAGTQNQSVPVSSDPGEEKDVNSNIQSPVKETPASVDRVRLVSTLPVPCMPAASEKEPKRLGRRKIKGRRGRPPGIPMTDEERKRESLPTSFKAYDHFKRPNTARKSLNSSFYTASTSRNGAGAPATKFSLRKKSTRSPLEMLEMKRRQEEAVYDMEQEKRQARLIHLREKRSARESGDGSYDDGDVGLGEGNMRLCSVVLSDFVKKLQLDKLDQQSDESPSREAAEREESPDKDGAEDPDKGDEDWYADLEDLDDEDEEWNVKKQHGNRRHIPRLKLTRIMKKGRPSQLKRSAPIPILPKPPQHEPIKLLIKTEPVTELDDSLSKAGSAVDISKIQCSGFEGSFLDFLKGKKEEIFIHSKNVSPLKKIYVSKPVQSQAPSPQRNANDINRGVEILSLPVSSSKSISPPKQDTSAPEVNRTIPVPLAENVSVSVPGGMTLPSSDMLPSLASATVAVDEKSESAHESKRVSSIDDEDDDILILDLDEGGNDQGSDTSPQELATVHSDSVEEAGSEDSISERNQEMNCSKSVTAPLHSNKNIHVDNLCSHVQRVNSNDEMGLMFESYNVQNDQESVIRSEAESDGAIDNPALSSKAESVIASGDGGRAKNSCSVNGHVPVTTIPIAARGGSETAEDPCSVKNKTEMPLLSTEAETHPNISGLASNTFATVSSLDTCVEQEQSDQDPVLADAETLAKDTSNCQGIANDEKESPDLSDRRELTLIHLKIQEEGNDNCRPKETISVSDLVAVEMTDSDSPQKENANGQNVDNSNTSPISKSSPKSTASTKKSNSSSENSKSPKHNTYLTSAPEDWKIKVILQSDKSSGNYACKRCNFSTPSKLAIESHIYSHIPGIQFRCAYCESEFSSMAATSSHLKNTHSLSEAKLHISRHIDEKNFYEKEDRRFSEENVQQSSVHPISSAAGGQSPPVIISVVVSGAVGSSRGGRSAPPRRFVCTHCGFATNIREDAEHHVSDLHPSHSLFACTLCNENNFFSESEIKDHSASVHPSRSRPYIKLPDYYDAEHLSLKEKPVSPDDRDNIFERMSSMFQDENSADGSTVDHRQKAKDYLYLRERWREKTSAEADSTTAVDYTDDHDSTEEQSAPQTPCPEVHSDTRTQGNDSAENEVSDYTRTSSLDVASKDSLLSECAVVQPDEAAITSSAASSIIAINRECKAQAVPVFESASLKIMDKHPVAEEQKTEGIQESQRPESPQKEKKISISQREEMSTVPSQPEFSQEGEDQTEDEGIGLKIVEVVSLSEQAGGEALALDTAAPAEEEAVLRENKVAQCGTVVGAGSITGDQVIESNSQATSLGSSHSREAEQPSIQRKTPQIEEGKKQPQVPTSSAVTAHTTTSASPVTTSTTSSFTSTTNSSLAGTLPLSYKCNACKVHTPYLLMMVKHLKAKHPNMRCFSCPYCKITHSFVSQKQLRHHVRQSHPDKMGRNEIALSEEAKKFVEAMVLPKSPECTRVGNRVVLEEDIHTCTYCQLKMTSLANVYEHLNEKHADLFEFVCPVCQSFKNKALSEISEHCSLVHKSSLDTDKVHVSVPKNLFTALTCISKNGKYIEKSLDAGAEGGAGVAAKTPSSSCANATTASQQPAKPPTSESSPTKPKAAAPARTQATHPNPSSEKVSSAVGPVVNGPPVLVPFSQTLPQMTLISQTPLIAIPLMSGGVGTIPTRPLIAFSSALFDTSSLLTVPPRLTVAPSTNTVPVIQTAAASSFLAPRPHHNQLSKAHSPVLAAAKQPGSIKNLPVLNIPTVKPRLASSVVKPVESARGQDNQISPSPLPAHSHPASSSVPLSISTLRHVASTGSSTSSPATDSLPEDEPNPDAFKIFNLRPASHIIPPSASAAPPPPASAEVPSVFPPVSAPITSGYIQGPIAGFPASMVISPNLLRHPFHVTPQQQLVSSMLPVTQSSAIDTHLSRHSQRPQLSASGHLAQIFFQPPMVRGASVNSTANAFFMKGQHHRELYLKQHRYQQIEALQQKLKGKQQRVLQQQQHPQPPVLVPRAHPAHQQPPSLSGQVYQPMSLSLSPQQQHPALTDLPHSSSAPLPTASSSNLTAVPLSARPSKGLHKRSSSLYQCPYCPSMVTLRALEVASHIQQLHPGNAVVFKKILS